MNILTIRNSVKDWFSEKTRIDYWKLDNPSDLNSDTVGIAGKLYPGNSGTQYPAEDLQYLKEGSNGLVGIAKFRTRLIYRYPGEIEFHSLPIPKLEALVEYLNGNALIEYPSRYIRSLEVLPVEYPVNPVKADASSDWFVHCNFSFNITFKVTEFADISDLQPTIEDDPGFINSITFKVNKGEIGFDPSDNSTFTEDAEIVITNPNPVI